MCLHMTCTSSIPACANIFPPLSSGRGLLYWRTRPGPPASGGAAQQTPPKDPPSQTMQLPPPTNTSRLLTSDQKSNVTVR